MIRLEGVTLSLEAPVKFVYWPWLALGCQCQRVVDAALGVWQLTWGMPLEIVRHWMCDLGLPGVDLALLVDAVSFDWAIALAPR